MVFGFVVLFNKYSSWGVIALEKNPSTKVPFRLRDMKDFRVGIPGPTFGKKIYPTRLPEKGDKVVLLFTMNRGGTFIATAWGFFDEFKKIENVVSNTLYRVMSQHIGGKNGWDIPYEIWRGGAKDFGDPNLRNLYNPRALTPHAGSENRKWWEISGDRGNTWEQCGCPALYLDRFNGHA